jgi:hypothetical protein
MISTSSVVRTLAGSGKAGNMDGTAFNASFNNPQGICIDNSSNIFIADTNNNAIRKVMTSGLVITFAIGIIDPISVKVYVGGTLIIASNSECRIYQISPSGVITTIAGSGSIVEMDGVGTAASMGHIQGISVDSSMNIYATSWPANTIRKISAGQIIDFQKKKRITIAGL